MARVLDRPQPIPSNQNPPSSHADTYTLDIVNLNNLLTRLEQNVISSPATEYKFVQQSHLQCERIGTNIEYAQTLLNKIERSLPSVKAPATRHERTTDLARKRGRYKRIKERFDWIKEDVEKRMDREDDDDIDDIGEGDDIWEGILPVTASEKRLHGDHDETGAEVQHNVKSPEETATLRQRRHDSTIAPTPSSTTSTIKASGTSTSTISKATTTTPMASLTRTSDTKPEPSQTATDAKETALSTHRAEQENLTTSLLNLASQLKASSEAFQTSLEGEKGILNRAVEGLDRNLTGMEAAGSRMGILRRMTEGRGWWGRMIMYAWIFALWLVALAIVYLGPKLRF